MKLFAPTASSRFELVRSISDCDPRNQIPFVLPVQPITLKIQPAYQFRQFHLGILNCGVPWNLANSFTVRVEFRLVSAPVVTLRFRWGDCGATGYGVGTANTVGSGTDNPEGVPTCGLPACTFACVAGYDAATVRPPDLLSSLGASGLAADALVWHYANANALTGIPDVVAAAVTAPMTVIGEFDEVAITMIEDIPQGRVTSAIPYSSLAPMATVIVAAVKSMSNP